MKLSQIVVNVVGGLAVLLGSFFITLYIIDSRAPSGPDAIRADDARAVKAALEKYKSAKGQYPNPYPGGPLSDAKADITGLPDDPRLGQPGAEPYRYVSDGQNYGLLMKLEGGPCITGVGTDGKSWWSTFKPTACPF